MMWLRSLWRRARAVHRCEVIHREIEEEMRFHVEMRVADNLRRGMSPEEAQRDAEQRFGPLTRLKEQGYEVRGGRWLESLWQDVRYGARLLRKAPGFTLVAVLTLALGIGVNVAIFTVVNTVLLRPLPFEGPDRLMLIRETRLPQISEFAISPGNFLDWKQQNTVFARLVAMRPASLNLTGTGDPERLRGMSVTDGFCALLGVGPQLGRDFSPAESQPGKNNVAILSHGLWQRRFGGDANIINRSISLDDQQYTVIGVMPAGFHFFDRTVELWTPLAITAEQIQNRGSHTLSRAVGRLKPGVTPDQARAEMSVIAGRLALQYPDVNTGWDVMLTPLQEYTVRSVKPALLVLLGAVSFVLLIACVNVANLLLGRSAGRQKEVAIRTALGAGRRRILRQLLTESALLAAAGGAAGLLLAQWGMGAFLSLAPQDLPRMTDVSLDGHALAYAALVTVLTGVVFGLVPAFQASRSNLNETMKDAGRGSTEGRRRQLVRSALIVSEVAAALVLSVGAGLMIKSFWRLQQVDPGFDVNRALTASVALPRKKYPEEYQQVAFFQQLLEEVGSLPGVQAVGATSLVPLGDDDSVAGFEVQGRTPVPAGAGHSTNFTNFYAVSDGYFEAMGITLLRGRLFTARDTKDSPHVAIINETLAKKIFPGEDPIGRRITFGRSEKDPDWFEIVGIVGDVKHYGLDQKTTMQTYEPYTQQPTSSMTLVARTTGEPTNLSAEIRRRVLSLDKEQPVTNVKTLDQLVATSVAHRRFSMLLLGAFAAIALMLAAVGIYGVISYSVAQRTHEIGIRMALGAEASKVVNLVVGEGIKLALVGLAIGLLASLALARLLESLLFGVTSHDPLTLAGVSALLVGVALVASYVPARRAAKVDPLVTLRGD